MMARRVFRATIRTLEEKFERVHVSGFGDSAVFAKRSIGWYVTFVEWPASLRVTHTSIRPDDMKPGDTIELTLRILA